MRLFCTIKEVRQDAGLDLVVALLAIGGLLLGAKPAHAQLDADQSVQIDFHSDDTPSGWNGLTAIAKNGSGAISDLVDPNGNNTGVSLQITDQFQSQTGRGFDASTVGWPLGVVGDSFWVGGGDNDGSGRVTLSGLDTQLKHKVTLYGGANSTDPSNTRVTKFSITGAGGTVTDQFQIIDNPDTTHQAAVTTSGSAQNGQITAGIDFVQGEDFANINGMTVTAKPAARLTLEVDQASGEATLRNPGSAILSKSLTSYQVTSDSGSLEPGNWNSLADQGVGSTGDGWEEGGNATSEGVFEGYFQGQTTLDPGDSYGLGSIFDTQGAQDLNFQFTTPEGQTKSAPIDYLQALLKGDANNDGVVDASDLTAIKNNFGGSGTDDGTLIGDANDDGVIDASDLTAIKNNFGESLANGATANAVPAPASVALLGLGGMMLLPRRRSRLRV